MNHRLLVAILASLSMVGALSIDAYLPALPAMAREFGASDASAQQTLTVYLGAFAFMSLFYGAISDGFGRRTIILVSLALYFVSSLGAGCAHSLKWLLVFRTLQGLSAAGGPVVGDAMVVDLFSGAEARRAMAYVAMIFGVAPAVAPILGGWLQAALGWRSIFFFIALLTFVLLAVCFLFLPESLPRAARQPLHPIVMVKNYWRVGRDFPFLCRCLGNAFAISGIFIYLGAAPAFILHLLHLTVKDFGWLFLPLIGAMTVASYLSARLSHRLRGSTLLGSGYAIMGLAALLNLAYAWAFPPAVPWAIVPLGLYGFGVALATPVMSVRMLEMFPGDRGLASSLVAFFVMIVFSLTAGVVSPLLFGSDLYLAAGLLAGFVLSALCWWAAAAAGGRLENGPRGFRTDRWSRDEAASAHPTPTGENSWS